MNQIILKGNLGRDPETRDAGDSTVCSAFLITSSKFKNRAGDLVEDSVGHPLEIWGKLGEAFAQYLTKGSPVLIRGEARHDEYEKDGEKRRAYKVRVLDWEFCSSRADRDGQGGGDTIPPTPSSGGQDFNDPIPF